MYICLVYIGIVLADNFDLQLITKQRIYIPRLFIKALHTCVLLVGLTILFDVDYDSD